VATTLRLEQHRRSALRASEAAFYALWRLLTSVRNAILTVLLLGLAALLGVLLPQVPAAVRDQPGLTAAWLELQHPRFGPLTPVLHGLGLFDIFHAWWFYGLVGWLALAIVVCTYSRIPPLWRQAFRPSRRIPDGLFERASAVRVSGEVVPARVEQELRRRRFKVWRMDAGGVTYLFADRFAWAQLGTFASHLALILFLAGALVTKLDAFSTSLTIAEGASAPVFPVTHESQILVRVLSAVGSFDQDGRPLDYHSDLVLYRNGQEAKRCTITVNDPCSLDGYRFHQAGFFGSGAELRVRDLATGDTIYREVLALDRLLPAPQLTIRDGDGAMLLEGTAPQTDIVEGFVGGLLPLDEAGKVFWVGLKGGDTGWTLVVFDPSQSVGGDRAFIPVGETASVSGFRFHFTNVSSLPSLMASGVPLPATSESPGDDGRVLLALENAVFGTRDVSAGDERLGQSAEEPPVLHIAGIAPVTVRLAERDRLQLGPYEYEFVGPRNFVGISVKRDRGDTLIWAASGLFVFGLALTLWIPRRRAWFRLRAGELRVVSQGRSGIDASTFVGE
jgi:cytochrome c biogenesis protein ResB